MSNTAGHWRKVLPEMMFVLWFYNSVSVPILLHFKQQLVSYVVKNFRSKDTKNNLTLEDKDKDKNLKSEDKDKDL